MLWDKHKYTVKPSRGKADFVTEGMHGYVHQLIVQPSTSDTIWSMCIKDKDGDVIYATEDFEGMLNDRQGFPVGRDKLESLRFSFYGLTSNESIDCILKIKERE